MSTEQNLVDQRVRIIKKLTGDNPLAYQIRWETFNHHFSVVTVAFCYLFVFGSLIESINPTGIFFSWDRLVMFVACSAGPFILFSMLVLTYPLKKHIKQIEKGRDISISETNNQRLEGIISFANSPLYKSLVIIPLVLMMAVAIWINFEASAEATIWKALQFPYFLYLTLLIGTTLYVRWRALREIN